MFDRINVSRASAHFWIYYSSLCLLAISLPTSRFMITVSLILLIANWVAEAKFRERFAAFFSNRPAVAFSLIYVLTLVGLLWTKDFQFALRNDLLHKLPSLFMPLILVTSPPIDRRKLLLLIALFIGAVLSVTLIGLTLRTLDPTLDFRAASPFVPAVYFNIMLLLAAVQLPLLVRELSGKRFHLIAALGVSAWLVLYIFYMRSLTGIASLVGLSAFTVLLIVFRHRSVLLRMAVVSIAAIGIGYSAWLLHYMYRLTHQEVEKDFSALGTHTAQGNPYFHDTTGYLRENGHLVHIYISDVELERAWNGRSELDFHGLDLANHQLRQTLYRFLASRGLKRDEAGVNALSDREIWAIEHSITNYRYLDWPGVYIRIHQMMMGLYIYRETSNPTWSTLTERVDLWRASWRAFARYPLMGWGTGSILHAVNYGLESNQSMLAGKNMMPHNQYIHTLLTLGMVGLALFILLYAYIVVRTRAYRFYIANAVIVIFAITFMANNTIEKQVGQNLFVLFSLLYFFIYPRTLESPASQPQGSTGSL